MEKKYIVIEITLLFVLLIFTWSIWNAFLDDIVPRHRTLFINYNDFENTDANFFMPKELPSSASNNKYYTGTRAYIKIAGYSIDLDKDDYDLFINLSSDRYESRCSSGKPIKNEEIYSYKNGDILLNEEFIEDNNIPEIKNILGKDDVLEDYRLLFMYKYTGGPINYGSYIWGCNEKKRIIEIALIDRH